MRRWWVVVLAAALPFGAVIGAEWIDDDVYVAEARVLVVPGAALGAGNDGTAAHDAAVVLQSPAIAAYVRDELGLDADPPRLIGSVVDGSNVVTVRVESPDRVAVAVRAGDDVAGDRPTEGEVIGLTVADIANAAARALVDLRGEQLRAGVGGALAEIERRLLLVDEELAALDAELATESDRDDPDVVAMQRAREVASARRAALLARADEVAVDGAATAGDLQVVGEAVVPTGRHDDEAWRAAAAAGAIGGGLGVVALVLTAAGRAAGSARGRRERGDRALAASGLSRPLTSE